MYVCDGLVVCGIEELSYLCSMCAYMNWVMKRESYKFFMLGYGYVYAEMLQTRRFV